MAYFLYPGSTADDSWAMVKLKLLGDMQLLKNLKELKVHEIKTDQSNRAKKRVAALEKEQGMNGKALADLVSVKNKATGGLFQWVSATIKCYDNNRDVEPKRKKAEEMKKQKA